MIIKKDEETQEIIQTPETLYECFEVLDDMKNKDMKEWVKMKESDAIAFSHHAIGQWIRNNWGLWDEGRLKNWFIVNEIQNADDMSGIILTAYHRMKNNKEIKLSELFEYYIEYYLNDNQKLLRRRKKKLERINEVYRNY